MTDDSVGIVIFVDDDPAICSVISTFLARAGIVVETVSTAIEARKLIAERNKVSLILLDVHLPGMSGDAFALELRHTHPKIQIIFLTGDETVEGLPDCPVLYKMDVTAQPQILIQMVWSRLKFTKTDSQLEEIKGSILTIVDTGTQQLGLLQKIETKISITEEKTDEVKRTLEACQSEKCSRISSLESVGISTIAQVKATEDRLDAKLKDVNLPALTKSWFARRDPIIWAIVSLLFGSTMYGLLYVKNDLTEKIEGVREVPKLDRRVSSLESSIDQVKVQQGRLTTGQEQILQSLQSLQVTVTASSRAPDPKMSATTQTPLK